MLKNKTKQTQVRLCFLLGNQRRGGPNPDTLARILKAEGIHHYRRLTSSAPRRDRQQLRRQPHRGAASSSAWRDEVTDDTLVGQASCQAVGGAPGPRLCRAGHVSRAVKGREEPLPKQQGQREQRGSPAAGFPRSVHSGRAIDATCQDGRQERGGTWRASSGL